MVFKTKIECSSCKEKHRLEKYLENYRCPNCKNKYIIPTLQIAKTSIKNYKLEGYRLSEIIEKFRLDPIEILDLLLGLGCPMDPALDLTHRYSSNWTESGWRRYINRTKTQESKNIKKAKQILEKYNINVDKTDLSIKGTNYLLEGIELFNSGEFYLSHEIWEEKWRKTKKQKEKDFYQALIQTAAVYIHHNRGNKKAVYNLSKSALTYLDSIPNSYKNIDIKNIVKINKEAKNRAKKSLNTDIPLTLKKYKIKQTKN